MFDPAMNAKERYVTQFREEATERLAELEEALLALESSPGEADLIGQAFRAMHTIKGSGAMFGFDEIALFTHDLETVFDRLRSGEIAVTPSLIRIALRSADVIRAMLDGRGAEIEAERAELTEALRAHADAPPASPHGAPKDEPSPAPTNDARKTYRILLRPAPDLLKNGTNLLALFRELGELGDLTLTADDRRVPVLEDLDPESCHLGWDAVLTTSRDENAIRDVFIFVEGQCELQIALVDDGPPQTPADREARSEPALDPARATEEPKTRDAPPRREDGHPTAEASSIRVTAEKLDTLVNLVGELVIAQARLGQIALDRNDAELRDAAEVMERVSSSLRDITLNIRMVPIGTTFGRFKRLVHDLSAELGKEVDLVTDGAETELDKTVIDRLGDPLVHIIRNSCDHGIESPQDRIAAGKPARGSVRLSAYSSGGSVFVEVHDDGRGLDAAAIREKAVSAGVIEPDAKLSEKDVFHLIFLPGLSTARKVSNLSGRGVGMDVVKRAIESLRGSVEVDSRPQGGTTIRLKLPLTLAIIDGLLVRVGDAHYVLPTSLVEECVELTREEVSRNNGNRLASVRGELVPYVCLRSWFGVEGDRPPIEQIAIARADGMRVGFVLDHVVGQHQTVIKTLGNVYRNVGGLSGATILSDGTVALILDLAAIARAATPSTRRLQGRGAEG